MRRALFFLMSVSILALLCLSSSVPMALAGDAPPDMYDWNTPPTSPANSSDIDNAGYNSGWAEAEVTRQYLEAQLTGANNPIGKYDVLYPWCEIIGWSFHNLDGVMLGGPHGQTSGNTQPRIIYFGGSGFIKIYYDCEIFY